MICPRCGGEGWIETCRPDGDDCRRETCPVCLAWEPDAINPREALEDDGVEYADPRNILEATDV